MKIRKKIILVSQFFVYLVCAPIFRFFLRLEVKGIDKIRDSNEPYIITPNHLSELDAMVVLVVFYKIIKNKPLFFVVREKSFYKDMSLFYGGFFFKIFGGYEVYKNTGDFRKSLVHHISIVNSGYSTCIFPEGTISKDGNLGEAKGGALFLAQETRSPILPVVITGTSNISLIDFVRRKRKVIITLCEPIVASDQVSEYKPNDMIYYKEHSKKIMQTIKSNL